VGLAIARGRALAGLGSNCRTADGPVPAFTCRDQLTLHVESPLAPTMRAWMSASDAVDLCARDSVTVDRYTVRCGRPEHPVLGHLMRPESG
jgi:hypothetical protein